MRRLVVSLAVLVSVLMAPGIASAKAAPIQTLKSPSGNLYKAGELCPTRDLNKESHSIGTTVIKCEFTTVNHKKHDYWVKVKV